MRKKIVETLVCLLFISAAFARTIHVSPGSYYNPCASGDTVVTTKGNYGYLSFGNLNHISIMNDGTGTSNFKDGFAFENCLYVMADFKGMFIGKNVNTTAIDISGKSAHITLKNATMDSVFSWISCKNNPDCDTSINNWIITGIIIRNFHCTHAAFDGGYLGNTSPEGMPASPCNVTYVPSQLDSIAVLNSYFDGSARQCLQLSEASNYLGHTNTIANDTFLNAGRALDPCGCQGADFYIGGRTANTTIRACVFGNAFIANVVLGGNDSVIFKNNTAYGAGVIDGTKNKYGAYPNVQVKNLDPQGTPRATFILKNNTLHTNTFGYDVGVELDPAPSPAYTKNNVLCNTGTYKVESGITYSGCSSENAVTDDAELVAAPVSKIAGITIYPNPVKQDNATVNFNLVQSGKVEIKLVDFSGNILQNISLGNRLAGPNTYTINQLGKLPGGNYIVALYQNNQITLKSAILIAR